MSKSLFFLNTQGIIIFILATLVYQYFIIKNKEATLHSIFSLTTAFILTVVLKELFLIPRPFMMNHSQAGAGLVYLSSLPSTHAALAFALATTVALHQKKEGIFLLVIASLISLGRVIAQVHYPSDIAVGILIGVLIAMFFDTIHFGKIRR